ncbi:MAG: hypothetical protein GIKADHBN_03358 [Phycisphaerales bacterium]|nr:hypothetical protein [Phycisphaerales bacterium]
MPTCREIHRRRALATALATAIATFVGTQPIAKGQIDQGDLTFDLRTVASGLPAPVLVTHAGDGSGRLFIVDQRGKVLILQNGQVLPTPFLEIQPPELVTVNNGYDERGLLGLAFHPDFASNGRVFVRYSKPRTGGPGEPCTNTSRGCHEEVLAEYRVMPTDPNRVDPASAKYVLRIAKPQFNHNGGAIAFGPDGYLYMSMGDGGGANDGLADNPPSHGPGGNGQNINTLMGKMLRLDVNGGDPYGVPADNPFVGVDGADEIYAWGMRNPFMFSFDDGPGGTGSLWLGEVGQNLFEEIDIVEKGKNYGWVIKEGFHCFDPFNPTVPPADCDSTGLTDPIAEYGHADGIAVVGGYVYRGGDFPGLVGMYVFGDFSTSFGAADGHLFYIDSTQAETQILRPLVRGSTAPLGRFVKGSGRDEEGNLYFCLSSVLGPSGSGGRVVMVARCEADFDGDGKVDASDFDAFVGSFIEGGDGADSDGSGFVDTDDFDHFVRAYESGCSPTAG